MIEVTFPTTDNHGRQAFAVIVFDSWSNIGGTGEVVDIFSINEDFQKATNDDWDEETERRVIRSFLKYVSGEALDRRLVYNH